jgi:hypothetical protein
MTSWEQEGGKPGAHPARIPLPIRNLKLESGPPGQTLCVTHSDLRLTISDLDVKQHQEGGQYTPFPSRMGNYLLIARRSAQQPAQWHSGTA